MGFALAPTAAAAGYGLETHESVGSTNALALERALAGNADRHWVVARRQEAGRGRRGRAWASVDGNLASTLLLIAPSPVAVTATLGFVAGLALTDALAAVAPGMNGRFRLKWPNDVLADRAKLAGILLESTMLKDGRLAVAIGIGANVAAHPDGLPYPATSLRRLGVDCKAERLFLALSDAWLENFRLWDRGGGLAAIRERWLARAAGVGEPVSVYVEGRAVSGVFETIDEDCRFMIREVGGGLTAIAAGDVHFGAVASMRVN